MFVCDADDVSGQAVPSGLVLMTCRQYPPSLYHVGNQLQCSGSRPSAARERCRRSCFTRLSDRDHTSTPPLFRSHLRDDRGKTSSALKCWVTSQNFGKPQTVLQSRPSYTKLQKNSTHRGGEVTSSFSVFSSVLTRPDPQGIEGPTTFASGNSSSCLPPFTSSGH